MLEADSPLERAIRALERQFGWHITVHDRTSLFCDRAGVSQVHPWRLSHKPIPACGIGFDRRCLQHCGVAIHQEARRCSGAGLSTCWKGLSQMVIPLVVDGVFRGLVTVGTWRTADAPVGTARAAWAQARKARPIFPADQREDLLQAAQVMVFGLLSTLTQRELPQADFNPGRRYVLARFLAARSHEPVQLLDLAREFGLSVSRTSHLVSDLTGMSFQALLLAERLRRATTLLTGTDLSIAEVGRQAGFPDQFHFNRIFTREIGMSPGRFRRQQQGSAFLPHDS